MPARQAIQRVPSGSGLFRFSAECRPCGLGGSQFFLIRVRKEPVMGVKKSGKGRRKQGQKKRRMRSKIRHRKG